MEETEKKGWLQSKVVRLAIALIVVSATYLGVSVGIIDQQDLDAASTVYPEISNGVSMIKAGQLLGGIGIIVGALVMYFRVFKTSSLLTVGGKVVSIFKKAA